MQIFKKFVPVAAVLAIAIAGNGYGWYQQPYYYQPSYYGYSGYSQPWSYTSHCYGWCSAPNYSAGIAGNYYGNYYPATNPYYGYSPYAYGYGGGSYYSAGGYGNGYWW